MKNLLYYPTFEPLNEKWLKYALIYIDNFSPIIPKIGEKKLTPDFKKIKEKTDLIVTINPQYEQASLASLDTIERIDLIEKNPDFYRDTFDVPNIIRSFENADNWNYEIFYEKFNPSFKDELIRRKYAQESPNGIITSSELAKLFMTFLANRIAQKGDNYPITDDKKTKKLSITLNSINYGNDNKQELAESIIDLKVPNLHEIPLEKFIEFRNADGIKELRENFNKKLNDFYNSLEGDSNPNDFIKSLEEYEKSYTKEILLYFGAVLVVGIDATTSMFGDDKLQIVKNLIKATPLLKSISSVTKSYRDDSEIIKGRMFLANIGNLS